jgi:opacity protein-like surface antigen
MSIFRVMSAVFFGYVFLSISANANATETEVGISKKNNWSGVYIGLDGSHATQAEATECISGTWNCSGIPIANPMQKASGSTYGAHIGYNWKIQANYILGVEASVQRPHISGAAIFPTVGQYKSSETKYDSLKTLQLRAGRVLGDSLIYLSGGLAWTRLTTTFTNRYDNGDIINFPNGFLSASNSARGHVFGVGAEHALTESLSLSAEFSRMYFSSHQFDVSTQINGGVAQNWAYVKVNPNLNIAKLSVNYRY